MNSLVSQLEGPGFYLAQFKNSDLAIFSYYIQSDKQAVIIDPTLDTQIHQQILNERGATLKSVFLTHYHADFISGHLEFKVQITMGQGSKVDSSRYDVVELKDNEIFNLGSITLKAIHTPGHTLESTTFLLTDSSNNEVAIFTGDTLFLGDVGRPDLATSKGVTKVDLAGYLFDSLQKLKKLDDNLRVYPAHGSGSACGGKKIGDGNFCTLGKQKQNNYALKIEGRNQFISVLVEDIAKPPQYYFHDAQVNRSGPALHEALFLEANKPLSAEDFFNLAKDSKIFDTRGVVTEGGLIKDSFWVPSKGTIASWIPMVAHPEQQILLIVEQQKGEETVERLLRLGFFNVKGYNNFKVSEYPGQRYDPKIISSKQSFEIEDRTHLDVRNKDEWQQTGVIKNAITIPLKQLKDRTKQVQSFNNLVVSCRSAMRARFALSILARNGISSIVLHEKVEDFEKNGHVMVPYISENAQ